MENLLALKIAKDVRNEFGAQTNFYRLRKMMERLEMMDQDTEEARSVHTDMYEVIAMAEHKIGAVIYELEKKYKNEKERTVIG